MEELKFVVLVCGEQSVVMIIGMMLMLELSVHN